MRSLYEKWRDATHLQRQVRQVFGDGSDEYIRCQEISAYWWDRWHASGGEVEVPPPDRLEEYIKGAEKTMRYYQREEAQKYADSLGDD